MNIDQETIISIKKIIDENRQIYERRTQFEEYCKNKLGLKRNLYDFCSYEDFLSYHQSKSLKTTLENIVENKLYFEQYYQDLYQEIIRNKQVLSYIKQDLLGYIKTKPMFSVEQIQNNGLGFLPDFYINFFLEQLTQNGHLEKIQMLTDVGVQSLYKRIYSGE